MSNVKEYSDQLEWTIIGTKDDQVAQIDLENTFFQENLSNKKLTVDYGYFGNDSLPLFIPDLRTSFPTITPVPITEYNNTLNVNSIDYAIRMTNLTTGDTYVSYVEWSPELPYPAPLTPPSSTNEMYFNKYYWSKSTPHFSQIVTQTLHSLALALGAIVANDVIQILVGTNSFSLVVDNRLIQGIATSWKIDFSHTLNKLFRLQSVYADSIFDTIVFSINPIGFANQTCSISNGLGGSNKWFPFDQLTISSDLSLRKVQNQNNVTTGTTKFYNTNYKNVILEFNILSDNPNQIYPYFEYITNSTNTKFIYFNNDIDLKPTYNIKVYLRNIAKNIIMPYTLNDGEYINLKLRYFTEK